MSKAEQRETCATLTLSAAEELLDSCWSWREGGKWEREKKHMVWADNQAAEKAELEGADLKQAYPEEAPSSKQWLQHAWLTKILPLLPGDRMLALAEYGFQSRDKPCPHPEPEAKCCDVHCQGGDQRGLVLAYLKWKKKSNLWGRLWIFFSWKVAFSL